jgi:heme/copper-type cytochrome/quinol oxidase subunit 2
MDANSDELSSTHTLDNSPIEVPPALWNPTAAGNWSLLFTPIFGSCLVFLNWKALGQEDKISSSRIWLIISILVFLTQIIWIPLLGFPYLLIWYFVFVKEQVKYVDERWKNEYPRRSWLYPLLMGLSGIFVLFVMSFIIGLIRGLLMQQ